MARWFIRWTIQFYRKHGKLQICKTIVVNFIVFLKTFFLKNFQDYKFLSLQSMFTVLSLNSLRLIFRPKILFFFFPHWVLLHKNYSFFFCLIQQKTFGFIFVYQYSLFSCLRVLKQLKFDFFHFIIPTNFYRYLIA